MIVLLLFKLRRLCVRFQNAETGKNVQALWICDCLSTPPERLKRIGRSYA